MGRQSGAATAISTSIGTLTRTLALIPDALRLAVERGVMRLYRVRNMRTRMITRDVIRPGTDDSDAVQAEKETHG